MILILMTRLTYKVNCCICYYHIQNIIMDFGKVTPDDVNYIVSMQIGVSQRKHEKTVKK